MKKIVKLALIIMFVFCFLTGCEQSTMLRTASFSEITSAGSENYGVRVTFATDSRLENKGVDVQVKFNKTGTITMWKENEEKFEYEILESDEWYSMTTIFTVKDNPENVNKEIFETYDKAIAKTYLFNYDGEGEIEITFRAVVGEIEENAYKTGEILIDTQPVSSQFSIKVK